MKVLLLFFLIVLLYVVFNVGALVLKVRRSLRQFQDNMRQQGSAAAQQGHRTTTTADGITIIDHRDPSEASKKIIPHDEGEYVEFKEE